MYKKKRYIVLFLLWCVIILNSSTLLGNPNYSFKHYNINNGLSQNSVHFILQDRLGFIWIGTKDGLNRFDGTSFKTFRFSPEGVLRDNIFYHILEDKNGRIWLSTDGGIYIYDPKTEQFDLFNAIAAYDKKIDGMVSDFVQDKDGDIWISIEEKGVFHYDYDGGKHRFYPVPFLPDGMRMISLCAGDNNDIWVFPYGLPMMRINKETGQTTNFHLLNDPGFFAELGEVHKVVMDDHNLLLAATSNKGLVSINIDTHTHQVLLASDSSGKAIFARTFERVDNSTLWIGSESGIYILNRNDNSVVNLRHHNFNPFSLSDNAIYTIYKDREGGIWTGSYFGGVDYYSRQYNNFELFYPVPTDNSISGSRVREFCTAPDGNIWIGTEDNGLNLFDPVTGQFLPLPDKLKSLYPNIHAIYANEDYLWVSTFSKGLNKFNLKTGELVTFTNSSHPNSLSHNSVFALCKDRREQLWVGTLSGLNIYNEAKNNFTRISELESIFVQDIFEDSKDLIWVSTYSRGVFQLNPETGEWKNFIHNVADTSSLPYNKITTVFEDSQKRLWIATQGGGFCLYNRTDDTFTTYNTTNGLPNDVVYQIVEDQEHNLWLSTNAGLVRYNSQNGTFKNYTVGDGLKTNQFNYKSSFTTADGTLYFGSIEGFVRFNPSLFIEPENKVPIVFTELFVNNSLVSPEDVKSLLRQSILYTDELTLPYNKNSFSLSYAILNYSNLNANYIEYMLEGFDREWIDSRGKQSILYSNLKPGKYTLKIKLKEESDITQPAYIKKLEIFIRPPFWLSGLAYFIYVVLLIIAVVLLARFLEMKSIKQQREKMQLFEQQKERELYRSKIDFFTNVAHEIRTPLSLIKAPLDHVIMTERVSDNVKENLQIMSKNTDRLLNLTNQLLDFRKTESDAYLLSLERHNVTELIRDTCSRFTPLATQRNVTCEIDLPEEDMIVLLDKEAFLKIISNLLNNAIKYGDNYVRLKAYISLEEEGSLFHLITENDGEKIPEAFSEAIFTPFFQIVKESERKVNGTGIGLALSRSLAELHKGRIELEDQGDTIRFHLTLPVGDVQVSAKVGSDDSVTEKDVTYTPQKVSDVTLLLVEDDAELLQFEEKFLSAHYHVKVAKNGREALEILRDANVNLIVSDIMMPEMDGFEFTKRVKTDIEYSHIPVILLTAKVNVQSKVQGLETGADAYVEKPFSLEVLMAQIANLLQNREHLRETFLKHPFIGANSMAHTKSDEEFIRKLHAIVQENLDNTEFVVENMAEQFNMSRASFYRKIKGILDLTPIEYIKVERLKKAAQLLREKNHKVNEICYMVGFNSPSYFTKCFQQQFDVLPKDFE